MRSRRHLLVGTAVVGTHLVTGCLGASRSPNDRDENRNETEDRNETPERAGTDQTNVTVTTAATQEPYGIGPGAPTCPPRTQNGSHHWGELYTRTEHVDEAVTTPAEAGDLFLRHYDRFESVTVVIPKTDTITWAGDTYNITSESETGDWYIIRPATSGRPVVLAIQQPETTVFRAYHVGNC